MSRIVVEILLDGENEFVRTKKVKTSTSDKPTSRRNTGLNMDEKQDDQLCSSALVEMESAEEKAMRIPPVVERVMHYVLMVGDLKNYRLVSNCWNSEATREMVQRDCLQIRLISFRNSFAHVPHVTKGPGIKSHSGFTLSSLNQLILDIGVSKFPASSFTFIGGDLGSTDAQTFFSNYGKVVKSLTIQSDHFNKSLTSKSIFINILNNLAPNVARLDLDLNVSFTFNPKLDDLFLFPLLSLKCFVMPNPYHEGKETLNNTTKEILRTSPNLESLENVHVSQCRTIQELGKTNLIKELVDFGKVTRYCTIEDQLMFANLGPWSIRKLVIRWTSHQNQSRRADDQEQEFLKLSALKLLSACQHSLEYLKLGPGDSPFHPGPVNFPPMAKLKTLCLYKFRDNFYMNLRGPWTSVEHLEIKDCVNFNYLDKLCRLCPNVSRLTVFVKSNRNLDPLLQNVFKSMGKLRHLELFVVQYDHDFSNLDSAFTGIKQSDCALLHDKKPKMSVPTLDKKRIRKYWVGSIPGLKTIDIFFSSWMVRSRQHDIPYDDRPLTEVSFLCGFDLHPSFSSLNIGYDKDNCVNTEEHIKEAFKSLPPSLVLSSDLPNWMRK